MFKAGCQASLSLFLCLLLATGQAWATVAPPLPNIYVSVEGCGVNGGTCTNVPNGTGDGTGNSSNTGYGDNQAAPLTLFEYTPSTVAQDTRTVQIYTNPITNTSTLYISVDSTEGKSNNRSYLGTLGAPPATSMYVPAAGTFPTGCTDGPSQMPGLGNSGGTGKETLTAATANGVNSSGLQVNLSPENYFFASPSVLYLADSGSPKQSSATSSLGAGGLQKWVNSQANGSGTWTWEYTLYKGLDLVANSGSSGTTGLLGLTGTVVGTGANAVAYLYATNYTIADLDRSYLYGITDPVPATTNPNTNNTFTQLAAAPQDSNFKGVSFAPSLPAGSATITSSPSGLTVSTTGTGCAPGTYITPVTLIWASGNPPCQLSVASTETVAGTQYDFSQWQDGTTATTDDVNAPTTSAVYTATFKTVPVVSVWPTAGAITYGQTLASSMLSGGSASTTGTFAFTTPTTAPSAGPYSASVTFTPSNTAEYTSVTSTVNVQVNKATLTVTANDLSKAPGAANPTLTASYSGFVNGDTASVLSGLPKLTTTATTSSPVGNYPVTVTQGTLSAANYTFAFVNGVLSVVAAPPVSLSTASSVSGSASLDYTLPITVTNNGSAAVSNVTLTAAKLGAVSASGLPKSLGSLAAGASGTFTVNFPGSVGADGTSVAESYSGTVTGGSFSTSLRSVTLP